MRIGMPASLRVIGRSVVDWWDSWLDMVAVTVVWLVAQITIIFGPPATFGYYYVISQMMSGQSIGVRGLIEGARKYFWKAWLWGVVNLLAIFITSFATWFYLNVQAAWGLYAAYLVLLVGYLWLCTQFYGLPYFMEQEQKNLVTALKNGILTAMAAPFFTFVLMVMVLLVIVSFVLVIPLFLGIPALVPLMGYRGMLDRLVTFGLRKREKTPKEIEAEESSRVYTPEFKRRPENGVSVGDGSAGNRGAAGDDVSDGEGQVEQQK